MPFYIKYVVFVFCQFMDSLLGLMNKLLVHQHFLHGIASPSVIEPFQDFSILMLYLGHLDSNIFSAFSLALHLRFRLDFVLDMNVNMADGPPSLLFG